MRLRRRWILSRALVREMLPTLVLATGVTTFLLLIRSLFQLADLFISHSLAPADAARFVLLGLPHVAVLTIPIGALFAVLMTAGRLSADSELVALQACGVPLRRVARPLLAAGFALFLVDLVLTVFVMPQSNRALGRLTLRVALSGAKAMVEPRVFIEEFTGQVLYVDRIDREQGRWFGVLLFDQSATTEEVLVTADSGELTTDPRTGGAWLTLHDAVTHRLQPDRPEKYNTSVNTVMQIRLEAPSSSSGQRKVGVRETDTSELLARLSDQSATPGERLDARVEIHKRIAIPAAALLFAFVGFPLGVRNRRGGRSFGLTVSVALIVVYYVLLNNGELLGRSGTVPPALGIWLPNAAMALAGALFLRRASAGLPAAGDRSRWARVLRAFTRLPFRRHAALTAHAAPAADAQARPRLSGSSPFALGILDRYLLRLCIAFLALVVVAVSAIYIVVNFSDNVDDIQKFKVPISVVGSYYFFLLPQVLHEILPMAFLIAFLGAAAVLERNNETTAIKAAGISLTRSALPLLLLGLGLGVALFVLDESVVQRANRASQRLLDVIRGRKVARSYRATDRPAMFLPDGRTLVNFLLFDVDTNTLVRPSIYVFDDRLNLRMRYMAAKATYRDGKWSAEDGWSRTLLAGGSADFSPHVTDLPIPVSPRYFGREYRKPSQMSFRRLREYIRTLRAAGYRVDRYTVQLHQKLTHPLSLVVLAWLALPFAFRMGRRGAMMGIAVAMVLGMAYIALTALVGKLGESSLLPPVVAAWAPTVTFVLLAINRHTILRT